MWEWLATLGPVKWVAWVMVLTAIPLFLLLVLWLFLPFGVYGSKRRLERIIFLNQQILTELVRLRRHLEGPDVGTPGPGRAEMVGDDLAGESTQTAHGADALSTAGLEEGPAAEADAGATGAHLRQTGNTDDSA